MRKFMTSRSLSIFYLSDLIKTPAVKACDTGGCQGMDFRQEKAVQE